MKRFAALLALLLASVALVACGGSSNSSTSESTGEESAPAAKEGEGKGNEGGAAASTLKIEANPEGNLEFVQKSATAKAGEVEVDFTNEAPLGHDVAIESENGEMVGKTEIVTEGSGSTTVNLKPGTYHFFCTVPGHRQAGMEGTLTVK